MSGAAFQAWLVGLHVSIADDPELDEDARTRHLRLAAMETLLPRKALGVCPKHALCDKEARHPQPADRI